jgi:hypothetical protein
VRVVPTRTWLWSAYKVFVGFLVWTPHVNLSPRYRYASIKLSENLTVIPIDSWLTNRCFQIGVPSSRLLHHAGKHSVNFSRLHEGIPECGRLESRIRSLHVNVARTTDGMEFRNRLLRESQVYTYQLIRVAMKLINVEEVVCTIVEDPTGTEVVNDVRSWREGHLVWRGQRVQLQDRRVQTD